MTDLRAQLLAAFDIEHREHLDAIRAVLQVASRDAGVDLKDAFRRAHSLKGAARAVDLPVIEDVANHLEAILARLTEGKMALDGDLLKGLHLGLDAIERYIADLAHNPVVPAGVLDTLQALLNGQAEGIAEVSVPQPAPIAATAPAASVAYLRVATDQVEDLMRHMHDWGSDLQSIDTVGASLVEIDHQMRDLRRDWDRLAPKTRGTDGVRDFERQLKDLFRNLSAVSRDYRRASWVLGNSSRRLQTRIDEIALVPISTVYGDFGRIVRDMAREEGRDVVVTTEGFDLQADRQVLQRLKDPIIHLLRNAIGHGGETSKNRRAKGKPGEGAIDLIFASRGGRLIVTVRDDGPGPDLDRIQETAIERGLLPRSRPGAPHQVPADQLLSLVFHAGFSTAQAVDRLSGRGMGLSVVAEAVRGLHGTVLLRAGANAGAEAIISVPLQASRQTVLSVDVGGLTYAIPTHGVERLLRLPIAAIENTDGRSAVRIQIGGKDVMVPIMGMASLLGAVNAVVPVDGETVKAVLLRRGDRRCALAVDAFHDVRQTMVGEANAIGIDREIVSGAILDGAMPALVLDPDALVRRWMRADATSGGNGLGLVPRNDADAMAPTILVVDDSITTRTLQKSILEAQGYRVLLSVDGLEALQTLRSGVALIDLVVADVEMPRMDGFSLLQAVKNDAVLASLPFILMTSRETPDDIRRGLDLGADAYLTKQKFDQRDLLATIGRLL